ncbi:MAG: glycosyltransferase family 4 protein [candidate division KSB1 bacterium]|nr:glycosyltransferase family 4 protein [candidate division KSB1 bacterium]MDZ7301019.1 glycosyltransferase family 4 protein [candidate division KSB1 bacterium]MDZ7310303.1 glycosyltransferase family 4 protein [candidate division KSB1 bacterium]
MAQILCLNPGQDVGGAEVYLANIARHLAQRHTLYLLVHPSDSIVEYFQRELPSLPLETAAMTYTGLPRLLAKTSQIIREKRIDVVHINGRRPVVLAPFLKLKCGQPKVLLTFHSSYFNRDETLVKALALWLLHFLPLHWCDRVIAVSDKVYRERRWQLFPKKKLRLIKNGIPMEQFALSEQIRQSLRAEIRQKYELHDAIVVGEVGRLVHGKGQHILLKALALCRQMGYDCKALLVGDGPSRFELENLSRSLQIESCVILTGHQPDTRPFLAAMDIFALPSLNEGLPLSLLEAMAMGLPVIATRSGGILEVIEDGKTGLLLPSIDAKSLARRLKELNEKKTLRQQISHNAQAFVRDQFDQKKMLALHDSVYNELMVSI